ncbi:MAG: sugar phosphate nucleotidyltransferase [Candidatus Hermodarchaeota archaeon]|nr:sugar phosphate nucleotidyltransferase [Candidatus Hermodarchaeota archaeon]
MKALILSAGYGTRLHPLTQYRPKAMLPLLGKPMLHHVIDTVREAGLTEIVVVVGHQREQIESYFGDGKHMDVNISYALQAEPKGEYDAVLAAETQLADGDRFLMTDCDIITTTERFKETVQAAKAHDMALSLVEVPNPSQFGVVALAEEEITTIVEKPAPGTEPSNLAVAGVYVFTNAVFDAIRKTKELEVGIQQLINEGHTVYGSHSKDPWVDVGRTWNILEASPVLFERIRQNKRDRIDASASISDAAHIIGDVWIGPRARIFPGAALVGPVYVGPDAIVGNNCLIRDYTVIDLGASIGFSCEVRNSVLMPGSRIGHLAFVGDSILGYEVDIGASVVLSNYRFDGAEVQVMLRGQLASTHTDKFGAVVGDTAKIGCGAVVLPGRTIGYNSWIDPAVVVKTDVADNIHLQLKQEYLEKKRRGPT